MKRWLCSLTLLGLTIAAFFGNFEKSWHGDSAEFWNFLLSALYLVSWGWFIWGKHSKRALGFACIWWGLCLFSAVSWIGLQYLHFPEFFIFGAWTGGALCLSQLFGLYFLFRLPYGGMYLVFLAVCGLMLGLSIRKRKRIG